MRLLALQTTAVLAIAIGAVAFTVSRTKICEGFRSMVMRRNQWLGALISCPYCLSHWLAFGATGIYRPRLVHLFLPLDYLVTAFVMVGLASFIWGWLTYVLVPKQKTITTTERTVLK